MNKLLLTVALFATTAVTGAQASDSQFILDAKGRQAELAQVNERLRDINYFGYYDLQIMNNSTEWDKLQTEMDNYCDFLPAPDYFDEKHKWRFMHWQYGARDEFNLPCELVKLGTAQVLIENPKFDIKMQCAIGIPQNHLSARYKNPCWIAHRLSKPERYTQSQVKEAENYICKDVKCGKLVDFYWQRWDYWHKFDNRMKDGYSIEHTIGAHLYGDGGVWNFTVNDLRKGYDWHYNVNGKKVYGYFKKIKNKAYKLNSN